MQGLLERIKRETEAGHADTAVTLAVNALKEGKDARLYYLLGNAHAKAGRTREAINAYLQAEAIDPESPAVEARRYLNDILAFYCKDLYNP